MKRLFTVIMIACLLIASVPSSVSAADYQNGNTLNNAQTVLGEFYTKDEGEVYWYQFTTTSVDSWYHIGLQNTNIDTTVYAKIYDINEVEQFSTYSSYNSYNYNEIKLQKNSTYFVKVYRYNENKTGKYQLTMTEKQDDIPDYKEEAASLTLGQPTPKEINGYRDVDYYKFTTSSVNSWYDLNLINTNTDTTLYAKVYDENDVEIYSTYASYNSNSYNQCKLNPNSNYYVKVYGYNENKFGKYQLKVTEIKDDTPDSKDNAITLKTGKRLTHSLNGKADEDWYKFKTSGKDSWYYFDLKNINIDTTTYLYIYDKNDVQVASIYASSNSYNNNYQKLTPNETYYIKVVGNNEWEYGKYQLIVIENSDDVKDTLSKSKTITINKFYQNTIDGFYDVDYFKFKTNSKNKNYKISLKNYMKGNNVIIELYDRNEVSKGYTRVYYGESNSFDVTLNRNTTYYLKVSGNGTTGTYRFGVQAIK